MLYILRLPFVGNRGIIKSLAIMPLINRPYRAKDIHMTTQNLLHKIGHEFALSAISQVTGDTSKQQLINGFLEPIFDKITATQEAREAAALEVVEIAGTIIDETGKVSKDAKNSAIRDFKKRLNRGLQSLGQKAKADKVQQIGLKTTGESITVQWSETELYYDKDEEGKIDKDKPMTKAAHTKKHGAKDESAKDETTPLDKGEERIVLNVSSPALLAGSIADVCKLHGLDVAAVAEALLDRSKPKLDLDWFTLPAHTMAQSVEGVDWKQAFQDKGGKLTKADVQAIKDSAAG
jgi:hypothetical protein